MSKTYVLSNHDVTDDIDMQKQRENKPRFGDKTNLVASLGYYNDGASSKVEKDGLSKANKE